MSSKKDDGSSETLLFKIPASLPLTITTDAKKFLIESKNQGNTAIKFSKGLQAGSDILIVSSSGTKKIGSVKINSTKEKFPKYGMKLDHNGSELYLFLLYPDSPGIKSN